MKTFVLSDSTSINSYGFSVDVNGIDTTRFATNPVMLYQHDAERVIGRWTNLRIEDGRLLADAEFDTTDADVKTIAEKVERGFLRGCSIGILVHEAREIEGNQIITRSELLEASVVSVPADPGAVVLYDNNHTQLTVEQLTKLCITQNTSQQMENQSQNFNVVEELAAKEAQIANLLQQIAELKAEKVSAYLDMAVSDGKITETEKPLFARLALSDEETVRQIIDNRPKRAQMSLAAQINNATENERKDWSFMDWMRKDNAGLQRMKANQPDMFNALRNAYNS